MAEIQVEHLQKSFGDFVAVKDSSFTVANGTFFCLLGPSGCGKTTTLRMIAGLELPTAGRVLLGDEDVTYRRASARDIAFVFQLFALYPHMNVRQNIGYPLASQGVPRKEIRARVEQTASILRITQAAGSAGIAPVRWRPAARGARARHRPRADGLHDGRTARRARFRIPSPDVRRIARAARSAPRHNGLRHARPDRGHVARRHHRGHEPRHHRAACAAARNIRPPRIDVRRRLHRLAADEFSAFPRRATARCAKDRDRWSNHRHPITARGAGPGRTRSRCAPRTPTVQQRLAACAARCSAPNTWGQRRLSRFEQTMVR